VNSATEFSWKEALSFPFNDKAWPQKFLIGILISLAGLIIPLLPALFVYGFFYEIMREVIRSGRIEKLPEWDAWEEKLKNGWRIFLVLALFSLPAVLVWVCSYFAIFGFTAVDIVATSQSDIPPGIFIIFSYAFFFVGIGVAVLLGLLGSFFMPAALTHVVAGEKIAAVFNVRGWWQILRRDFWGYLVGYALMLGLLYILAFVGQIMYFSVVLICLLPVFAQVVLLYFGSTSSAVFGYVHYQAQALLDDPIQQ